MHDASLTGFSLSADEGSYRAGGARISACPTAWMVLTDRSFSELRSLRLGLSTPSLAFRRPDPPFFPFHLQHLEINFPHPRLTALEDSFPILVANSCRSLTSLTILTPFTRPFDPDSSEILRPVFYIFAGTLLYLYISLPTRLPPLHPPSLPALVRGCTALRLLTINFDNCPTEMEAVEYI